MKPNARVTPDCEGCKYERSCCGIKMREGSGARPRPNPESVRILKIGTFSFGCDVLLVHDQGHTYCFKDRLKRFEPPIPPQERQERSERIGWVEDHERVKIPIFPSDLDEPWSTALIDLATAVKKECDKFNFPDEDRPELWEAYKALPPELRFIVESKEAKWKSEF